MRATFLCFLLIFFKGKHRIHNIKRNNSRKYTNFFQSQHRVLQLNRNHATRISPTKRDFYIWWTSKTTLLRQPDTIPKRISGIMYTQGMQKEVYNKIAHEKTKLSIRMFTGRIQQLPRGSIRRMPPVWPRLTSMPVIL